MIRGQLSNCFRPLSKVLRTSRKRVEKSRYLPLADMARRAVAPIVEVTLKAGYRLTSGFL